MTKKKTQTLPASKLLFKVNIRTDGKRWTMFPRRNRKYRMKKTSCNKCKIISKYQKKSKNRRKRMRRRHKVGLFAGIFARGQMSAKLKLKNVKQIITTRKFHYSGFSFKGDNFKRNKRTILSKTLSEGLEEIRKKQQIQRKKKRKKLFSEKEKLNINFFLMKEQHFRSQGSVVDISTNIFLCV